MRNLSRRAFMATAATLSSAGLAMSDSGSGSKHGLSGSRSTAPGSSNKARSGRLDPNAFLNPGAESPELVAAAAGKGLEPIQACSIVNIGLRPEMYPDE